MNGQASDAAIEERLRSAAEPLWQALFDAAHRFLARHDHVSWAGGQQVGTTVVEGEERPVLQMPWADYSDDVDTILRLLYELGVVHPFAWHEWDGTARYRGPTALRAAPVADAARMATAIVRADRFCEGTVAVTIRDGTFGAVLERLLRWHDTERDGAD